MSPRIVDVEQKKLQIIGSAFTVLREKGFINTKMEDIAKEAGVSKGTVYLYFKNKQELLGKTLETMLGLVQENANKYFESIEDPEERLRQFIRTSLGIFKDLAGMVGLFFEAVASGKLKVESFDDSFLARYYQNSITKLGETIEEGIEKGAFRKVDAKGIALVLICTIDGLQIPHSYDDTLVDIDRIGGIIEEMAFRFLT